MDIASLNIGVQAGAVITLCVIAGVKFISEFQQKQWYDAAKIVIAAIIGAAASYGLDGVTVLAGVAYGLAGSGLITTVGFGSKQAPAADLG